MREGKNNTFRFILYCVYLLLPFAIVVKGILSDFVVTWSTMTTKHILYSILYY